MTLTHLKVLMELDAGDFHAGQCERARNNTTAHRAMREGFDFLLNHGYLELIGESFELTTQGREVLEEVERTLQKISLRA